MVKAVTQSAIGTLRARTKRGKKRDIPPMQGVTTDTVSCEKENERAWMNSGE